MRESVTNVVRHSAACLVRISFADGELRVDNDGLRPESTHLIAGLRDGAGLRGPSGRLAPLGATAVAQRHGDHWSVVVRSPGTGPTSAATTRATQTAP